MKRRNAGFSMIEMMAVVLLIGIGARVAVVQLKSSLNIIDADAASSLVVSELQYARQMAVNQRRNTLIEFVSDNEIKVTRQDSGGGTTVMADVTLPTGYAFGLATGVGDTPDGFGNGAPVYLSGATSGTFLGDGTFVSATGVLASGSVFTIGSGNGTARAITLTASTGKTQQYWLKGTAWIVR